MPKHGNPVPGALTATQSVVVAEGQRKVQSIADVQHRCQQLAEENRALVERLEAGEREAHAITDHLRGELAVKNARVGQLQAQLDQVATDASTTTEALRQQAAQREVELEAAAAAAAAAQATRIQRLELELNELSCFKQRQREVSATISGLRAEAQGLREALDKQRSELEVFYANLNSRMRGEYEHRLEELKRAQEEELAGRLDASVRRILGANQRMAEELRLHSLESDALAAQLGLVEQERGRLVREVALKGETEDGLALRGAKQSSAIKHQAARITGLETTLTHVVEAAGRERAALAAAARSQVEDAHAEADALRRLIKLKTRELKHVRRLAHEVLLQRSNVEIFLLSSLQQVKSELERQQAAAPAGEASPTTPEDCIAAACGENGQPGGGCAPTAASGVQAPPADEAAGAAGAAPGGACMPASSGLDIKGMGWGDRERVLHVLFAKVHAQREQLYYANLQQQGGSSQQQRAGSGSGAGRPSQQQDAAAVPLTGGSCAS